MSIDKQKIGEAKNLYKVFSAVEILERFAHEHLNRKETSIDDQWVWVHILDMATEVRHLLKERTGL